MSTSFVDAKSIQVEQPKETLEDYIDIYCLICFSPYQKQEEETQVSIADNYRFDYNTSQDDFFGNFFSPRVTYVSDLCGTTRGKVVESHKILIDCSRTTFQFQLKCEDVCELIKRVECQLRKILEKYWFKAKYVTLHIATYSFTLTEDIANCFLYSIYPSPQYYPEDNTLFSYFVDDHYCQLLKTYHDAGVNIEIEYVLVYDTEPFLETSQPLEGSVTENYCPFPSDSNKTTNVPSLSTAPSDTPKEPSWPTNSNGAFEITITKNEYNPDLILNNEPNGNWSWKPWSDALHTISKGSGEAFGTFGLIGLGVAAVAGVAILVGGSAIWATVGIGAFVYASAMGTASLASSVVDGYTYLADYVIDNDEKARQKATRIFSHELFWTAATFGAGKGVKSILRRTGVERELRNIQSTNQGDISRVQNRIQNNSIAENKVTNKILDIETKIDNDTIRLTKRQQYLKKLEKLKKSQKKLNNKQEKLKGKLSDLQDEQKISDYTEKLLDNTSDTIVNTVRDIVDPPEN